VYWTQVGWINHGRSRLKTETSSSLVCFYEKAKNFIFAWFFHARQSFSRNLGSFLQVFHTLLSNGTRYLAALHTDFKQSSDSLCSSSPSPSFTLLCTLRFAEHAEKYEQGLFFNIVGTGSVLSLAELSVRISAWISVKLRISVSNYPCNHGYPW